MGEDEILLVIREAPFRSKVTWLLKLFGAKPLAATHRNAIVRITDLRNAFVHYKWKAQDEEEEKRVGREVRSAVIEFEKTIKYLRRYESKNLLHNTSKRLRRVLASD